MSCVETRSSCPLWLPGVLGVEWTDPAYPHRADAPEQSSKPQRLRPLANVFESMAISTGVLAGRHFRSPTSHLRTIRVVLM